MVEPTPELIRAMYAQGFTNDQFTEYLGIDTTSKEMKRILGSRKAMLNVERKRMINKRKNKRIMENSNTNEKVYTVYTTKDGRKELKVCYATSTAYVSTDGVLTEKIDDVTLSQMGRMVASFEEYDSNVTEP